MRVVGKSIALAATISTLALAGCIGNDLGAVDSVDDGVTDPLWSILFEGTCWEGGFVAPSGMEEGDWLVEPWVRGDIYDEVGRPTINQAGEPEGPISGNWHEGFQCPTAVQDGQVVDDFIFGWVGDVIEAPAWDQGGADMHVYTTGLGLQNGTFRDRLIEETKVDVTVTYSARIDYMADNVVYEEMRDLPKGIYKSQGVVTKYRDVPERTIRLWWLVPTDGSQSPLGRFHEEDIGAVTDPVDGGPDDDHHMMDMETMTFHPVYLDLHTGGGEQFTSLGGTNYACHGGVDQHGPQGELCLPEITVLYEHKSLSLTFGRIVDEVVLDDFFWH